jgi:hypothetical protein
MTTVDQFLKALAMVESSDDPEAWGDAGRAMGRWQVHPARYYDELRRWDLVPEVSATWDQTVAIMLREIWEEYYPIYSPTQIAMYWHLGHFTDPTRPDWDAKYAARFAAELAKA